MHTCLPENSHWSPRAPREQFFALGQRHRTTQIGGEPSSQTPLQGVVHVRGRPPLRDPSLIPPQLDERGVILYRSVQYLKTFCARLFLHERHPWLERPHCQGKSSSYPLSNDHPLAPNNPVVTIAKYASEHQIYRSFLLHSPIPKAQ